MSNKTEIKYYYISIDYYLLTAPPNAVQAKDLYF